MNHNGVHIERAWLCIKNTVDNEPNISHNHSLSGGSNHYYNVQHDRLGCKYTLTKLHCFKEEGEEEGGGLEIRLTRGEERKGGSGVQCVNHPR